MEEKINTILSQMILEEKVGQMQQLTANMQEDILEEFRKKSIIGSFLHVLGNDIDKYLKPTKESRLKIPPIFGIDAIHGHALLKGATVFPSQLAMACTFDEDLVEQMGEATAHEVAADGLNWVFSPVLCLGRDLRWGRIGETFGEDAELASRLGSAIIKGYQKNGLVAACAKHYLGYGEATGGRDSYDAEITERKTREVLLKPFKAAIKAGCMTFMTAYGSIDGKPMTINYHWLTEVLKEELGFDGFVVTDWDNIRSAVTKQKVAENIEEACVDGIMAGNDMCMITHEFLDYTVKMVKAGKISESVIDEAVRRILRVKARLGLLDDKPREHPPKTVIGCKQHTELNYRIAVESTVLMKNDGVLPLKNVKKIALIGPNAKDVLAQYGDWTYYSHPDNNPNATPKDSVYTVLKGIKEVYADVEVVHTKGCTIDNMETEKEACAMLEKTVSAAKDADIVIAVLGDNLSWNGEGCDIAHPVLRGRQLDLIKRINALNKKIITVLINGKPLILTELEKYSNAVIETFNGGDMCGLAVARLIKGEENFSGKLPISFAYEVGSGPNYYNQYDHWHNGKYKDIPQGSPYPFGYGLSYSEFVYSKPKLSQEKTRRGKTVKLSITVMNKSTVGGKETVQVYFRDKVCKMLTPIRSLLDFKKVYIPSGESKKVEFDISVEKLGYYDERCAYRVDAGEFQLYVSGNGVDFQEVVLTVVE